MKKLALFFLLAIVPFLPGAEVDDAKLLAALPARPLGPATMGGRIVDLDVVESDPRIQYVAAASGGVWKSTDGGDSWKPVFDQQSTLCIGDVTIAPSNPEIVWVGTGEANARNSVSWGDGVYKSTDAGKTWQNMGLRDSHHIGRIAIHPTNPDIVYVAALGHLWGPNKERGLYKTADGGKTWNPVKFINEDTGFIDVVLDPSDPELVYAAAYQVRRDGFSGGNPQTHCGPGSGLFRSSDGGKTWEKMKNGLPDRPLGRCGITVYRKDPRIVYAVIATDRTLTLVRQPSLRSNGPSELGGVFRSEDKGKTWTKLNDLCPRPFYYGKIRLDPNDDRRVYLLGIALHISDDGGRTFTSAGQGVHPDHHGLWINPKDSNQLVLGNDGGLYVSKDRGRTWEARRGLTISQFYSVAVDMRQPYRVYGGLQDNGSWGGPSATDRTDGITIADWKRIGTGDGFQCLVDPTDANTAYYESQYGGIHRVDLDRRQARRIKPAARRGQPEYRFNWNSPMLLSPHDPKTIYYGGNHLFRSRDRGDRWDAISPDLSRGKPGPSDSTGHTLTTIAESPLKAGLLYAGTDDGNLFVTPDGGKTWTDLTDRLPGMPRDRWITRVECSHHAEGKAYVAINRYRNDDRKPYLFRTTDHGATWTPLASNLPVHAPVHVVRESSRNKNLLFAGTEFGLFASLDGGQRWQPITQGLPAAVTVHDLVIHPRDRELVIGTHGRGVYVLDVGPLEDLTKERRSEEAFLCTPRPARLIEPRRGEEPPPRSYSAPNPPYGAVLYYHLASASKTPVSLTITDAAGKEVTRLDGSAAPGLHQVVWDLKGAVAGEYAVTLEAHGKKTPKNLRVEQSK